MKVQLTVQDAAGRAAETDPGVTEGFFRYVSGVGEDYGTALEEARAAVPEGYSVIIIRRFDDGLAPEIPVELDATQQPAEG